MLDTGLAGKIALVTGANHGIGAATARALAHQGVAVMLHYLRLPGWPPGGTSDDPTMEHYAREMVRTADVVADAIRAEGGRAATFEADLADPAAVPALFDATQAALGPVDILINNADHSAADTFIPSGAANDQWHAPAGYAIAPITAASFDAHFAVNSRATALMMAEYARRHVSRHASWGRIINLSTDGAAGYPGEVSYWASKAAVESLTRAAARELAPFGITANVVSPGPIQTGWISPTLEAAILPDIPLGRLGTPEDVADVIVFLASQQARWLTGQVLHAGGGHRM